MLPWPRELPLGGKSAPGGWRPCGDRTYWLPASPVSQRSINGPPGSPLVGAKGYPLARRRISRRSRGAAFASSSGRRP